MNTPLPTIDQLKAQAKRLRGTLQTAGTTVTHSRALEMIADQHGYRDWNTLSAAATKPAEAKQRRLGVGDRVSGHYLGHRFRGEITALEQRKQMNGHRITVHFDTPVNVSKFDDLPVLRQRVASRIGPNGRSPERTSNGVPVMQIDH